MEDNSLEYFIIIILSIYVFISLTFIRKLFNVKKEMRIKIESLNMRNYEELKRYENSLKALKLEYEDKKLFYENQIAIYLSRIETINDEKLTIRNEINTLQASLHRSNELVNMWKEESERRIEKELKNMIKKNDLMKFLLINPLLTEYNIKIYHRSLGPLQINKIDGLYNNTHKGKFSISQFGDFLFFNDIDTTCPYLERFSER